MTTYESYLENILELCNKYPFLFDEPFEFFSVFTAPDETANFSVKKSDDKFTFYLSGSYYDLSSGDASFERVIKELDYMKIPPQDFYNTFKKKLAVPLGKHLASKELQ